MAKNVKPYLIKANLLIYALQKDEPMKPVGYATILGLVAAKVVEACVAYGEDKQTVVDALCESVRKFSE